MQTPPPDLPEPDFDGPSPPGEHLLEWCEERQLSLAAAARLDLSAAAFDKLLNGQLALDPPLADKLATLTRVPASVWLNLEGLYRGELVKEVNIFND